MEWKDKRTNYFKISGNEYIYNTPFSEDIDPIGLWAQDEKKGKPRNWNEKERDLCKLIRLKDKNKGIVGILVVVIVDDDGVLLLLLLMMMVFSCCCWWWWWCLVVVDDNDGV